MSERARSVEALARRKLEKGYELKKDLSGYFEEFNAMLSQGEDGMHEARLELDQCLESLHTLQVVGHTGIDTLIELYHRAIDSILFSYRAKAERLQKSFESELELCEDRYLSYMDRTNQADSEVRRIDRARDEAQNSTDISAVQSIREYAESALNEREFPNRIVQLKRTIVAQEKEHEKELLEKEKQLHHLKSRLPREAANLPELKKQANLIEKEVTSLRSQVLDRTRDNDVDKLKQEKKYLLESLRGITRRVNQDIIFYRSKLTSLARNYNSARCELMQTLDRLERIRRLHSLCNKFMATVSLDIPDIAGDDPSIIDHSQCAISIRVTQLDKESAAMEEEADTIRAEYERYVKQLSFGDHSTLIYARPV
jgi:hypothetical protein